MLITHKEMPILTQTFVIFGVLVVKFRVLSLKHQMDVSYQPQIPEQEHLQPTIWTPHTVWTGW
jgi:hypothetical protein